jgi:Zn finger protein HypA/HybF involved in hydrogenase expression
MKVFCPKCLAGEEIVIPDFSDTFKLELSQMAPDRLLYAVKLLVDTYSISHRDAKYIVYHINLAYGKCNRCKYNFLDGEYINCPKCGSLNFNWEITRRVVEQ